MRKTDKREPDYRIAVNIDTLAGMVDCGRSTAAKIGKDAGAEFRIGKRTLYRIDKIERYLDAMSQ